MTKYLAGVAAILAVGLVLVIRDNARLRGDLRELRAAERTEDAIDGAVADGVGVDWRDRVR